MAYKWWPSHQHTRHAAAPGSLNLLFPPPEILFSQISISRSHHLCIYTNATFSVRLALITLKLQCLEHSSFPCFMSLYSTWDNPIIYISLVLLLFLSFSPLECQLQGNRRFLHFVYCCIHRSWDSNWQVIALDKYFLHEWMNDTHLTWWLSLYNGIVSVKGSLKSVQHLSISCFIQESGFLWGFNSIWF